MRHRGPPPRAIRWIAEWCVRPNGRPVRLTPEEQAMIHRIYAGDCFEPVGEPLAAYLVLIGLAGPPDDRSEHAAVLHTDIFSLWGSASPELRTHLHRRGETVTCPALGTCWSRAA